MFSLKIATHNAAFGDDPPAEVARILRHIAGKLEQGVEVKHGGRIGDHNGNTVGEWWWR